MSEYRPIPPGSRVPGAVDIIKTLETSVPCVVDNAVAVRERIGPAGQYTAMDEILTGRVNVEMVGRLCNCGTSEPQSLASQILERINVTEASIDELSASRPSPGQ